MNPRDRRAARHLPALLLLVAALLAAAGPATAQEPLDPEARDILLTALDRYEQRVADVDDYTVYQTMNGAAMQGASVPVYLEKRTVDGFPRFVTVPPHVYRQERLERAGLEPGDLSGLGGGPPDAGGADGGEPPSGKGASGPPGGMPPLPEGLPDLPGNLPGGPGETASRAARDLADRFGGGGLPGGGDPRQRLMQKGMQSALGALAGDGEEQGPEGVGPEIFAELGLRSRLIDEESVDGEPCWVIRASDLEDLDFVGGDEADAVEVRSLTMWIDRELYVTRKFVMEADMRMDGGRQPVTVEARMSDFREVEGLVEPFRKVVSTKGMMDAVAAEDPEQAREMEEALAKLEQMEEQLEKMPPQQRRMVEAQMGPMMERMKRMREGGPDGMEVVVAVEEIRVNEGPPSALGTGSVSIGGPVGLEIGEVVVQASPGRDPDGGGTLWSVRILGGDGDRTRAVVQLVHRGDLPASGEAPATGGASVRLADGRRATLSSGEDGATLTVVSRTGSRLVGEFEFAGEGAVRGETGEEPARAVVRGTFEAPIPRVPPGTME